MTKYKVNHYWRPEVEKVEVEKETEQLLQLDSRVRSRVKQMLGRFN